MQLLTGAPAPVQENACAAAVRHNIFVLLL